MNSELNFLQSERKWSNFILLHVTVNLLAPAIEDNVFNVIVDLFIKTKGAVEVWDNNMWFLISILLIIMCFHTDIILVLLLEL